MVVGFGPIEAKHGNRRAWAKGCQGGGGAKARNTLQWRGKKEARLNSFGTFLQKTHSSAASGVCACRRGIPSLPHPAPSERGSGDLFPAILTLEFIGIHRPA